jgi:hypothetical protein
MRHEENISNRVLHVKNKFYKYAYISFAFLVF